MYSYNNTRLFTEYLNYLGTTPVLRARKSPQLGVGVDLTSPLTYDVTTDVTNVT